MDSLIIHKLDFCCCCFMSHSRFLFPHAEIAYIQMPVKGYKFWPLLNTYCHRAVEVSNALQVLWHRTSVFSVSSEGQKFNLPPTGLELKTTRSRFKHATDWSRPACLTYPNINGNSFCCNKNTWCQQNLQTQYSIFLNYYDAQYSEW